VPSAAIAGYLLALILTLKIGSKDGYTIHNGLSKKGPFSS